MAALDWSQCSRRPGIENLEDLSIDEVIDQFDVTREQIEAVLEFVAESLRSDVPTGSQPRDASS